MDFRNREGSTGYWDAAQGFVAFASQEEADAGGRPTRRTVAKKAPEPTSDLPEDFPERDLILGTQFKSLDALNAASDDDLLAVDGIGPAKLKAIRAALKG